VADVELAPLVALARAAGRAILDVAEHARGAATMKSMEQGPVTEADLVADRVVREGLAALFPDDTIVTEETWRADREVTATGRVWFVDPLDGTREFVEGRDEYSVMIGLVDDGVPRIGVVHQPSTGVTWAGDARRGVAFRIDDDDTWRARDIRSATPGARLRVAVSRSHSSEVARAISDALDADVVLHGSVGLKAALLVDDVVDAYVSGSRRIKMWDTAGPSAIVAAAGGAFTALDGTPLQYVGPPAHGAGVRALSPAADDARARIDALVAARNRPGGQSPDE